MDFNKSGRRISRYLNPFRLATIAILAALCICHVDGARKARSYLSLPVETNGDNLVWDQQMSCKEALTDLSFAPPGSSGLSTGKLTLSSLAIGQMGSLQKPNGTSYEEIPVKLHNLDSLNKYGSCLGLGKPADAIDWAKRYRNHLQADTSCRGNASTWKACSGFIDGLNLDLETSRKLTRRDFVMYTPTLHRRSSYNFDDRHFTAAEIKLAETSADLWHDIDEMGRKFTALPSEQIEEYNSSTIPNLKVLSLSLTRPVAVVCVCTESLPTTADFDAGELAQQLMMRNKSAKILYQEPECHCHTMDVNGPVSCPRVVRGVQSSEDVAITPTFGNEDVSFRLARGDLVRDAPYLRPYVHQTGALRCHGGSILGETFEPVPCEGRPILGPDVNKSRLTSCSFDVNSSVGIQPVTYAKTSEEHLPSDNLIETRLVELVRLIRNDSEGMRSVAQMLARAQDPTGERIFEENIGEKVAQAPSQLTMNELLLLVVLPACHVLAHLTYKIILITPCVSKGSRSTVGTILVAVGDLLIEAVTAAFLWTTVAEQKEWIFEGCMELPILAENNEGIDSDSVVDVLITHCTKMKLEPDILAASVSSAGAFMALILLALEFWHSNWFQSDSKELDKLQSHCEEVSGSIEESDYK